MIKKMNKKAKDNSLVLIAILALIFLAFYTVQKTREDAINSFLTVRLYDKDGNLLPVNGGFSIVGGVEGVDSIEIDATIENVGEADFTECWIEDVIGYSNPQSGIDSAPITATFRSAMPWGKANLVPLALLQDYTWTSERISVEPLEYAPWETIFEVWVYCDELWKSETLVLYIEPDVEPLKDFTLNVGYT